MTREKNETSPRWKSALRFSAQLGIVLGICALPALSREQRAAVAQALRDPMSILSGRSPGERDAAKLRQTKIKHQQAALPEDVKKALDRFEMVSPEALTRAPNVFDNASEPELANGFEPDQTFAAYVARPGDLPGDTPHKGGGGGGPRPYVFIGGGGGGGLGGGGGGGGSGGGKDDCKDGGPTCGTPTGEPNPPPPIVSVPEPGTWAMIIVGFFTLGGILRSKALSRAKTLGRTLPRPD